MRPAAIPPGSSRSPPKSYSHRAPPPARRTASSTLSASGPTNTSPTSATPYPASSPNSASNSRTCGLQAVDDGLGELAGLDLGGAFHEAGEVVGHDLVGDRGFECGFDVVRGLGPAEVLEHHHA